MQHRRGALVALVMTIAACGGIATIDGESGSSGAGGEGIGGATVDGSTSAAPGATQATSSTGSGTVCGSHPPIGEVTECFRAWSGSGTPCVSEVCDSSVNYWRSVCLGTKCDCFHNNTVQPLCSCTRAAADACPSPTCCPDPWQG